jgi:hypothetical protein
VASPSAYGCPKRAIQLSTEDQWYSDVIDKFAEKHPGNPTPIVFLLPGAPHYVYINNEAEVVRQMRNFLGIPVAGN